MSLIKFVLWNSGKAQEFKAVLPPRGRICPTESCLVSDSMKRKIVRFLFSLSRPLVHSALVYTSDYEHILNSFNDNNCKFQVAVDSLCVEYQLL